MGLAMSTQPSPTPVRLRDIYGSTEWAWAYCLDCHNNRFIRPGDIPLAPEFPIYRISERMKCSACGSRNIHTKTTACWPGLDPSAMLALSFKEHGRLVKERGLEKGLSAP